MSQNIISRNCYIYVLNTLADWEIGHITAELQSRRFTSKDSNIRLVMVGSSLDPIKTMGGITISPEYSLETIDFNDGDILVLPGADSWLDEANQNLINMVPELLEKRVTVAAICGATVALANAGILDNRIHTSNSKEFLNMVCPEYKGASFYRNTAAVVDKNLITASGLAPLEFSCEIFRITGAMRKETLEAWFQLYKTNEEKYFYSLMESLK